MPSIGELESLDYQALRKLAKSKNIRQSGKGVTKKKLVSLLWNSFRESSIPECLDSSQSSSMESPDQLPLQEVPLESILPIFSPKEEAFGGKKNLNIEVDLNDSNKENSSNRRLTFDILPSQSLTNGGKPEAAPSVSNKRSPRTRKVMKKVTIAKTPTKVKHEDTTPKRVKIVKTPAAVRSSTTRPSTTSHNLKTPVKRISEAHGRTPGTTRTVALRLASSAKKKEMSKVQSKIPKLNANKPPNFASIHQVAFEKMASLLDVEQQRVLRKRQIESVNAFTAKMGIMPVTTQKKMQPKAAVKKTASLKTTLAKKSPSKNVPAKKSPAKKTQYKINPSNAFSARSIREKGVHVFNTTNIPSKSVPLAKKMNMKETAVHAAKKLKPTELTGARDQNRTFLKGVRINKRFEMQMKNRGLM